MNIFKSIAEDLFYRKSSDQAIDGVIEDIFTPRYLKLLKKEGVADGLLDLMKMDIRLGFLGGELHTLKRGIKIPLILMLLSLLLLGSVLIRQFI